jgi:uncharacterized membrane protein YphA (DoxX/SURF4 family)
MKSKAVIGARLLLGLIFFVFGLNGFLNFLPPQPPLDPKGLDFVMALMNTGYMFPLIKGTEVLVGILLLAGVAVPFALVLLAPIALNILLFHMILSFAPALPIVIWALGLFLAWSYRGKYAPLFRK